MKIRLFTAISALLLLCGCAGSSGAASSESTTASVPSQTETTTASQQTSQTDTSAAEIHQSSEASAVSASAAPEMTLIGHASVKLITSSGTVIYVDPYQQGDYTETADIILVTHEHSDHNQLSKCKTDDDTVVLRSKDIHPDKKEYKEETIGDVTIKAVPAENKNHNRKSCVGYVISFDGILVYHSGDTSYIDDMKQLSGTGIDYALYPIDGQYNMDAAEAIKCADTVGAVHNIPIHWFSADPSAFVCDGSMQMAYGETITLEANE